MNKAVFPLLSTLAPSNGLPLMHLPGFAGALALPCPRKLESRLNNTFWSSGPALDSTLGLAAVSTGAGTSLPESTALLAHAVWEHSAGIKADYGRAPCVRIG